MELTGSRAMVATAYPSGRLLTDTAGAMALQRNREIWAVGRHDLSKWMVKTGWMNQLCRPLVLSVQVSNLFPHSTKASR